MGWECRKLEALKDTWGILVRKRKSKMVVGRSSDGWNDNIKLDLQKGWEDVE